MKLRYEVMSIQIGFFNSSKLQKNANPMPKKSAVYG